MAEVREVIFIGCAWTGKILSRALIRPRVWLTWPGFESVIYQMMVGLVITGIKISVDWWLRQGSGKL